MGTGDVVTDIAGEKDNEEPVEHGACVVEEEGGDHLGQNAHYKGDEKSAPQPEEELRTDEPEKYHSGGDDAGEKHCLGDNGGGETGDDESEHHAHGHHQEFVAEETNPWIVGLDADEDAGKGENYIAKEDDKGFDAREGMENGDGQILDHKGIDQKAPKEGEAHDDIVGAGTDLVGDAGIETFSFAFVENGEG